ncbi:MAG: hypothetical protein ACKVS9_06505 [Phycisphaerae bacterium]
MRRTPHILSIGLYLCAAIALLPTAPAFAGYTGAIGGTGYPVMDFKADADPASFTAEERAYIDKIIAVYDDVATDAEAIVRARQLHKNVCDSLNMVKCVNADVGNCLLELKKKGRICISFNMSGAHGTASVDKKTGWTADDKININAKHLGTGALDCLSGTFYWLVTTLLHEGIHAGQSYELTPAELDALRDVPGDPTSPVNENKKRVAEQKKKWCNEIDAHTAENNWIAELEAMKAHIAGGGTTPLAAWNEATKKIFAKLMALKPAARTAALTALCDELKKNKKGNDSAIAKYEAKKAACAVFLAADVSTPEAKRDALAALLQAYDRAENPKIDTGDGNANLEGEPRNVIIGNGQSGIIEQVLGETTSVFLSTGLTGVRDLSLRFNDSLLLVAGITPSGGGAVRGYRDNNNNGVFEPFEQINGVQSNQLRGLRDLFLDVNGNVLAYDRGFGQFDDPLVIDPFNPMFAEKVVRLIDFNADGVPDAMGPVMYIGPSLQHESDTFVFSMSPSGPQMEGFIDGNNFAPAFAPDEEVFKLSDPDFNGSFDPGSLPFDGVIMYPPTWGGDPDAGDPQLIVHGKPGHPAEIRVLGENGLPIEVLGLGLMSAEAITVPLSRPLAHGDQIQIVDLQINMGSVRLIIPCPGDVDGDNDVDLSDLSRLLANFGVAEGAERENGDLDGDGDVDLTDLSRLLSVFGSSCN